MPNLEDMNAFLKYDLDSVQVNAFGRVKIHLRVLVPDPNDDTKLITRVFTVSRNELARHAIRLAKHDYNPDVKDKLEAFKNILASMDNSANWQLGARGPIASLGRKIASLGHLLYDRNKKLNRLIDRLPDYTPKRPAGKPSKKKRKWIDESTSSSESSASKRKSGSASQTEENSRENS